MAEGLGPSPLRVPDSESPLGAQRGGCHLRETFKTEIASRHARLREALAALGADGFAVFSAEYDNRPNVQYLTGFTGSAGVVLIGAEDARLIVDSRYFEQANEESAAFGLPVRQMEGRDPWPEIRKSIAELGIGRLAFEEERLSAKKHLTLRELGVPMMGVPQIVMRLRAVKSAWEIARMRRASRVAADAFESVVPRFHVGMTEAQAAAMLAAAIRERGAQQLVKGHFVVASGPRGARPHGVFSNRVIEDGDLVTLDFGAVVDGYVSDMTRTLGFGDVPPEMRGVYETVREANARALAVVSAQRTGAEIEALVRAFLTERGHGAGILHAPGHGIGLELHEQPALAAANAEKLPAGSVVTIEPGVYLPGLGGVRIEDAVVVTEEGCEVLTSGSPRELRILI